MKQKKKKEEKFHTMIVVIAAFFILLISFLAYMINTSLEDVLRKEYGGEVVTHQYEDGSE